VNEPGFALFLESLAENYSKISSLENSTVKPMQGIYRCFVDQRTPLIDAHRSSHCIQQVLEAVRHCHDSNIVHRDLKVSDVCACRSRSSDGFVVHL
jgi:serine/threonine protein kinase